MIVRASNRNASARAGVLLFNKKIDLQIWAENLFNKAYFINLLGLTRETVATELKKLKDKGFVYYDKWQFVVYTDKIADLM